ncbi:transglutaminase domain-containing protein [Streptococcus halichoeri]|uniref:transglutaminase domain-containing protein n=1 Tax=Streptococcus halichoeri TaxID=254785 RepID=UPI001F39C2E9|nr:transglutaminase domain-containing protein [Streptococcus halichoeri]
MKRKTIGSYLALIAGLLSLTSLSVQAEDTYTYPSRQGDSYTNSYYHYPPRNYDARQPQYRAVREDSYRSHKYDFYQKEYDQLARQHEQLIATYKQLKASYDATKQASDSELRSLSQKWQELNNRFQVLVRKNPVVGGNYAIENLKSRIEHYNNRLASYQASQDFITSNQETLNRLDQLDAERRALQYGSVELNSNLQTTNSYIEQLNQQLRTYPFTTPLADLQSQQTEIEAQINQIERDKAAYKPAPRAYRAGSDSGAGSRRQRRQAPESESENVPLWHEMRNEGLDHSKSNYYATTISSNRRVDLSNISDLKTLQEKSDLAHYQRAKEIVFHIKRSDLTGLTEQPYADTNLSAAISRFIKEKLAVMPNTRGVTSGFKFQVQFYYDREDLNITLMPDYYMTDEQYQEYDNHLRDWTNRNILSTDTEIQKIDKIQDYIMTNYHYAVGKVGGHTVTGISVQTPYAFLKDKEAVCQAYAQLFKDMGRLAGLDVYYIQGYGDPAGGKSSLHAWNIVKVNGQYYHVDLTWNDTIDQTNKNHTYTLRGNNFMKQTHLWNVDYQISDEDYQGYPRPAYYNNGRHPYRISNYSQPVQANYRSASPFAYSEQRQPQPTHLRQRRSTANNSNTGVRYKIVFGREATLGRA